MKTLIVYSSQFGNTEKIAQAIAEGCKGKSETKIISVDQATNKDLQSVSLLIVGSPTQGGRATMSIQEFIKKIPDGALVSMRVTAFDTRFQGKNHNIALRLLMKIIDYAAPRIAMVLEKKGGKLAAHPEGFFVLDKEGPLVEGELERATAWGRSFV